MFARIVLAVHRFLTVEDSPCQCEICTADDPQGLDYHAMFADMIGEYDEDWASPVPAKRFVPVEYAGRHRVEA